MRFPVFLLLLLTAGSALAADVVRYSVAGIPGATGQSQLYYIDGRRIRHQVAANLYYLYDSGSDRMLLVDTAKRSAFPVARTLMSDVSDMVSSQEQKIRDLLARSDKLPPEARVQLEKALASMQALKQSAASLHKQASDDRLEGPLGEDSQGRVACVRYRLVSSSKAGELCLAGPQQLGLSREAVAAFTAYQAFLGTMTGQGSLLGMKTDAMPVWVRLVQPVEGSLTLQELGKQRVPDGWFDVPAGYAVQDVTRPTAPTR